MLKKQPIKENGIDNNKTIEIEAKTISEAIKKAISLFHADKDQLDIHVVKEEKRGLFGMNGSEQAKIRVKKKQI
ncbi:MAG: Jag N-terminal domain-containing protein [Candidatus Omnitrophica bacterium]|nr:Jag N-terminal domain-containing protein [Candidatus Omnitrophota bacterium]